MQSHLTEVSGYSTCCSPTEMAPLDVIYTGSDGIAMFVKLQNVKVVQCGCRAAIQVRNVTRPCDGSGA